MNIERSDTMPEGWQLWLDWHRGIAPDNEAEIKELEAGRGRYLGYVRLAGRELALPLVPKDRNPNILLGFAAGCQGWLVFESRACAGSATPAILWLI